MSLQTLPYVLVYIGAFVVSGLVFYFSWKNKTAPGVYAFAIAVALEISWLIGYIFEINANSLEAKVFWDNFQYIGSFYAPIALLIFSFGFVGTKVNARWLAILTGIIPTLALVAIFANVNPDTIRVNTQVVPGVPYDELSYEFGSITSIGNNYLYLILLAYLIVLFTGFRRRDKNFRTQLWLVLIGMGFPIVGIIVGQFLGLKFANQRDTSPLLFVISNAIIAFGVLRFRLFNLLPLAREALFETIDDVLIILNNEDIIVDANAAAQRLISNAAPNPIGIHIGSIFSELYQQFGSVEEIRTEIIDGSGTAYDLKITPLYDRSNQYIGRLINAHDITQQKNTEKQIQATSEQNQRRAAQFRAIATVASTTTALQNQEQTLTQVAQTISQQLGHYHVGVFLLNDTRKYAVLKAVNSEGGRRMLERGHLLEVGEVGIVGFVAARGKPRIALDTGADAAYFDNPDLPETKSEVALPLMLGSEILGVLDVQSTTPNAFTEDDMDTLLILASQVSITIQNTRLYEENTIALENAEKAYRQLTGETWQGALKAQKVKGYVYDGINTQPLTRHSLSEQSISIPVIVRGQNIGALRMEAFQGEREWTDDEIAMLNAAAERAALALENARLLTQSQKLAAKERTISEISTKISAQSDVDELLKTAALELGRTLPGMEIAIQLRKEEAE